MAKEIKISSKEDYLNYASAVSNYIDDCLNTGNYEFTEEDINSFKNNLDKCIEDLRYIDEESGESSLSRILKCYEAFGLEKNEEDVVSDLKLLLDTCLECSCPEVSAELQGWEVKISAIDHSVQVFWKIFDTDHWDNDVNEDENTTI